MPQIASPLPSASRAQVRPFAGRITVRSRAKSPLSLRWPGVALQESAPEQAVKNVREINRVHEMLRLGAERVPEMG